jgi:hypothetical protein
VIVAQREFKRAYVIDRRMNADESYDVPSFRGQLANAQQRWYQAEVEVAAARQDVARSAAQVAGAKEAYAKLVRAVDPTLVAVARIQMQLSGWTEASAMRRRGLKVVDILGLEACKRSTCFRRSSGETSYLVVSKRRSRRAAAVSANPGVGATAAVATTNDR